MFYKLNNFFIANISLVSENALYYSLTWWVLGFLIVGSLFLSFFDTDYQIFMSATIDKQSFCENMGLEKDDVAFVDTPKSPFPIENRTIDLLYVLEVSA